MSNCHKLSRRSFMIAAACAVTGVIALFGAPADAQAATLAEIKQKGVITFGMTTDQPPFSYINASGQNEGYEIDIMQLMAKDLGVKAVYVPITSANRIPLLLTGKVDMLICGLGIYADRAKVIHYVAPYAWSVSAVYGPKGSSVARLQDLSGKTIGVEKGSSLDKFLTDSAPKDANIQRYDDASSAAQALLSGQIEYLGFYSPLFVAIDKAAPGKFASKIAIEEQAVGMAVSPQSKELGQWAGAFWTRYVKDGVADTLYQKYFGVPYPNKETVIPGVAFTATK